jgi:hypothetical protein
MRKLFPWLALAGYLISLVGYRKVTERGNHHRIVTMLRKEGLL